MVIETAEHERPSQQSRLVDLCSHENHCSRLQVLLREMVEDHRVDVHGAGRGLRLLYGKRTGVAEVDTPTIVPHDKSRSPDRDGSRIAEKPDVRSVRIAAQAVAVLSRDFLPGLKRLRTAMPSFFRRSMM